MNCFTFYTSFSFPLSGTPIGGDLRRLVFWDPMVTRLKNRLSGWNIRFLSFGGRLVQLKSVLTFLHVYVFSFFKAPSSIISSIESLLGVRTLGKSLGYLEIYLLRKEYGGSGVRQLREFNLALL
jgi:hypothetical protein